MQLVVQGRSGSLMWGAIAGRSIDQVTASTQARYASRSRELNISSKIRVKTLATTWCEASARQSNFPDLSQIFPCPRCSESSRAQSKNSQFDDEPHAEAAIKIEKTGRDGPNVRRCDALPTGQNAILTHVGKLESRRTAWYRRGACPSRRSADLFRRDRRSGNCRVYPAITSGEFDGDTLPRSTSIAVSLGYIIRQYDRAIQD